MGNGSSSGGEVSSQRNEALKDEDDARPSLSKSRSMRKAKSTRMPKPNKGEDQDGNNVRGAGGESGIRPPSVITRDSADDGSNGKATALSETEGDIGRVTPRLQGGPTKTNSMHFPSKLSPKQGNFDNISSVLISKSQEMKRNGSLRNLGNYDDLDTLFQDIEDDNEFEFSMSNPTTNAPTAVVTTKSQHQSSQRGGWNLMRKTRGDDDGATASVAESGGGGGDGGEEEEGEPEEEGVGTLVTLTKKTVSVKRESYAQGLVKSLFPGKVTVQDLLLPLSPNMQLVRGLVLNHKKRRELIQELLPIKGDLCTRVRFVAAVDQFEQTKDFAEQQKLGNKILQLFFSKTSKFGLTFTQDTMRRVEEDFEFLVIARQEVLQGLAKDDTLLGVCRAVDSRKL
ncbi:hypothetical protein BASA81_002483 [Batrachochytrium salamandrivorans]|nr:hypothetical protein BASA81_002483 [Batrachochytrium salamandrivorans]